LLSSEGVFARAPGRLGRLRDLVGQLAEADESVAPTAPAALQAQEDELMAAVMTTLDLRAGARSSRPGRPAASRKRVLGAALGLIAASGGDVLYVEDLCHVAHVSERTLRNVFHESFGMGPIRYLRLRQLHRIHATLRVADPARDTVTKIAADCGIWDFSRLAREYRALFGELPSQTLRNHVPSPN
jgi:AraC family ethanolamine operon transcriptional activator